MFKLSIKMINKIHCTPNILVLILLLVFSCISSAIFAQKDTTKKTATIDITSSYKPVLRNAVKINLSATQLIADTTPPKMSYNVPSQNLFYSYQPISLNPLALQQDTNLNLGIRNYLKVGYGNFTTPYVNAGFSFGDGKKTLLNLYANYISSTGTIQYQNFSQLNLKASGSYFLPKNEAYGAIGYNQFNTYLYGYNHATYNYTKSNVLNQYQDVNLKAGIRNTTVGDYGITYNPTVQVDVFSGVNLLNESTLKIIAPIQKQFGDVFAIKIKAIADITSYTSKNLSSNVQFTNNVFQIAPSIFFSTPKLSVNGGLTPTWDKNNFVWLPNIFAEMQLKEKVLMLQAGWVGTYTKNTFQNLYAINPYIQTLSAQTNTKEIEYYGGIKATLSSHFNFSAKVGVVNYSNFALFVNDTTTDGKSFKVVYEPTATNFKVHGDFSYINQDKFTLTTGLTLNGYTGFNVNAKAWNTIPLELNSSIQWWAFKQVMFKANVYAFAGGNYIDKGNVSKVFNGGTDVSVGTEFKVNKTISAWLDVNNILNNTYQRWHNYQVYGLNFLGGVKVSF